jgi:putative ABC transport system substrate-binding protein
MLADQGWIEGKNVSLEFRSARSDPIQLTEAAAELARLKVDVIWAPGPPFVRAAYAATRTIPIIGMDFTTDPVAAGYAQSYARPGGNLTGVFLDVPEFSGKWMELLTVMVPDVSRVAVIWDPSPGRTHLEAVQRLAQSLRLQLQVLEVHHPEDIDKAFSELRGRPQALVILPSPMIYTQSERLAKLAVKYRLPATSMAHLLARSGGLLSYGPSQASANERCAVLVAKILAGANPADIPVERPTKFDFILNLKSANALGVAVPDSVLLRADEVER